MTFNNFEVNLMRQWFNALQDICPEYLIYGDYALAVRLHEQLGMQVPDGVLEKRDEVRMRSVFRQTHAVRARAANLEAART